MDNICPSQPFRPAFNALADRYDKWYESVEGAAVFCEELACLNAVCPRLGRRLEVGVGTDRSASALGIAEGIDPSVTMLEYAARRGIRTHKGLAEHLTFSNAVFDGVLVTLPLCFAQDAREPLCESVRVLRAPGTLVVGLIPSGSP